ncbi:hypothetical protein RvY_09607 [Ramazzottius varieornatus]|uniref:Uncharacterized protein n=1 Tax=Ramazzottius varieornatus TaxID=947166 RepID=A0A1D1VCC5_RAMVA|nr:hypothetical protein RvY_09607 [Ramazzottius varieornatus]
MLFSAGEVGRVPREKRDANLMCSNFLTNPDNSYSCRELFDLKLRSRRTLFTKTASVGKSEAAVSVEPVVLFTFLMMEDPKIDITPAPRTLGDWLPQGGSIPVSQSSNSLQAHSPVLQSCGESVDSSESTSDSATCGPVRILPCQHPSSDSLPVQVAAQTLREEILELLRKTEARVVEMESALPTASSLSSRVPAAAPRSLNRSASHNGTSNCTPVRRVASFRQDKLLDLKSRLQKLHLELEAVRAEGTPSEITKLKTLKKFALFQLSPRAIPKRAYAAPSCDSSVTSGFGTSKSSTCSTVSRTSSLRKPAYGRSVSYSDRPASASSTTSKSNNLLRSAYVCSITSGLEKEGFVSCVSGKETKLRVILWSKDVRSRPPSGPECLQARLEATSAGSEGAATASNVVVRQLRADTFELSFTLPDITVSWKLHVTLQGSPITGSPFLALGKKPVIREEAVRESLFAPVCSKLNGSFRNGTPSSPKSRSSRTIFSAPVQLNSNRLSEVEEDDLLMHSIGSFGRTNGHFLNPQGICITDDGPIAVTDSQLGIVQVFTMDGEFVKRIGQRGRKPGQLLRPTGITFAPHCMNQWNVDIFVVADYENRTIVVFDMEGVVLASFGASILTGPKGVVVATNGDILVIDNRSNSLVIFRNGKLFKKAWTPSSSQANLAGPHYVTVSRASGEVFVSDFHHHSIKVFDNQYNYRWSFGSFNADGGMGSFSGPTGIAVDHRGLVVADWGSGRIQLFDHSGSFLAFVTYSRPLYGPQGLALGHDGSIYVCDPGNHCVRVYRHPLDSTVPASASTSSKDDDSESQISS